MAWALAIGLLATAWQVPATPAGRVSDYAGILSPATVDRLNTLLEQHERQSSNQIVVVTIPTLDGRDISDVTFAIGQRWAIGQGRRDNGVIFGIAPKERRVRIEVGKGLEGGLTDLQSHIIIDDIVTPAFAAGDFDRGVREGTLAIVQAIRGEFRAPAREPTFDDSPGVSPIWSVGVLLLLLLLFLFFPRAGMLLLMMSGMGRGRRGFSGGGGRFGGGGASGSW